MKKNYYFLQKMTDKGIKTLGSSYLLCTVQECWFTSAEGG